MLFGDAGYRSVGKREEAQGPQWHIAMQPGKRRLLSDSTLGQMIEKVEKIKASIRAKVEHPFHVIKNLFRHKKPRYRGLAKNHAQLYSLFLGDQLRVTVIATGLSSVRKAVVQPPTLVQQPMQALRTGTDNLPILQNSLNSPLNSSMHEMAQQPVNVNAPAAPQHS